MPPSLFAFFPFRLLAHFPCLRSTVYRLPLLLAALLGFYAGADQSEKKTPSAATPLVARAYKSGFEQSHDNYNACFQASNGKVYYVLCSASIDVGAQMYSLDPSTGKVEHVGDLTEAAGEKGLKAIPQGKSHVNFVESGTKLYFATHMGYYTLKNGREEVGVPPRGYKGYPGGHFLSYDLVTGKFEDLAKVPAGEGILAMAMDTQRGRLYGLTWPSGLLFRYDLAKRELKDLGPTSEQGEKGTGSTYRVLCRSLAVNPEDGSVYFTTSTGTILRYRYDTDSIEKVEGCSLKKDYFGCWNPDQPGHMGYNWRQTVWYPEDKVFYGVHGNSGYLFRFDPRARKVEVVQRIVSEESRTSGMYDQFNYGYLGFTLGPDGHTLYYLTGAPREAAEGAENCDEDIHLITYHVPSKKYVDHGALALGDGQTPAWAQAIAVGRNGEVYTVSQIKENAHLRAELISFPDPQHR